VLHFLCNAGAKSQLSGSPTTRGVRQFVDQTQLSHGG